MNRVTKIVSRAPDLGRAHDPSDFQINSKTGAAPMQILHRRAGREAESTLLTELDCEVRMPSSLQARITRSAISRG